ncbi:hypothetical protein BO82DRAFT_360198 [Aspergillus uvarum CBS 121591]|uniref:Uncharacterized protein n=1 Tax=Aspergillus uvarum CBS 121591 TaxID=1448315 RepID=A0A319CPE6_9EURO|nr:hypothetical protein BO82DRAFT_360198 [Aspergillus uvarum CBS 121591]PYH87084.1 hypothetical protein BO82DRAFT_360198 [Aspergillus uvarum CBS 121591]
MERNVFFTGDALVQQATRVVSDVVDGKEEPDTGAQRIDDIIRPYFLTPEQERKTPEPLEPFWVEVTSTAGAMRYDSKGQDRLIQLMCNLSRLPPLVATWYGAYLWTSFPELGVVMRENFPSALPEIDPDPTAKCCGRLHVPQDDRCPKDLASEPKDDKWIAYDLNQNSFMARVLGNQLRPWKQFGIWQLRSALEYPHVNPRLVDHHLANVREWIFHAGYELYRQRYEGFLDSDEDCRTMPGPLYRGRADIPRERWIFWKERIPELAKFASDDFQETAAAVVDRMNKIEEDLQDIPLSEKTSLCY